MDYQDYYQTLGVARTASQAEIKKAFRKLAREHHPDTSRATRPPSAASRRSTRPTRSCPIPRSARSTTCSARTGSRTARPGRRRGGAAGNPFAGFGAGRPGRATSATSSSTTGDAGGAGGFSDFFRMFFAEGEPATEPSGPGRGRRPTGGADVRGDPQPDGHRRRVGRTRDGTAPVSGAGPRVRPRPRPRKPSPRSASRRPSSGTTRRVEIDGKRLEVTIPRGADNGTRIKLTGQGPGGGDLVVVVKVRPHPVFTRRGADLERELPITLEEALLGGEVPVTTLKGRVLLRIPAGTQNGRIFRLKGQGMPVLRKDERRRPPREGPRRPAGRPHAEAAGGREDLPRPRRPARPALTARPNQRHTRRSTMKLDRYTEKAQEAILAAQRTAEELQSPVLDAEHVLHALVEPDDGIPAETLRRIGVDLNAFRGRARRDPEPAGEDPGRLDGPRPARQAGAGAGRAGGPAARRRVRLDRAPAARRSPRSAARAASCSTATARRARRSSTRSRASAAASASRRPRRRARTPRSRSTAATSPPRPAPASSTRSSAGTRRSAGSSRSSAGGRRTTRS